MKKSANSSRRKFIKTLSGSAALVTSLSSFNSEKNVHILKSPFKNKTAPQVRIGLIGAGIIGHIDTDTALKVPGVELRAVCDLYKGRLIAAKEKWGKSIFTTRDYREVVARPDIDAVLICTSDNWHQKIAIDAMKAGKHVYCEKPMVQYIDQGKAIIDTQKSSKKVFQVGSQRASSVSVLKAREYFQSGVIGEITNVQTTCYRSNAKGAWVYSIPTDASPSTVDFDTFLGDAPKIPFDAKRFFRWRNYKEHGTGVAGDLIVHLLTTVHVITGAYGPNKIFALGNLNKWKDGRNAFDLITSVMDYKEAPTHNPFQLITQINLAHGKKNGGFFCNIYGTEGAIEIGWNDIKISRLKHPTAPGFGGYDSYGTFSQSQQKDFEKWYKGTYGNESANVKSEEIINFEPEAGYDDRLDHMHVFFKAIHANDPSQILEDAAFGLRSAAPSIACNLSADVQAPILWDPIGMKLI